MKSIIKIWQHLHYNIYRLNSFSQMYGIGLPFTLLYRNRKVKEFFKNKRGIKNPELFFKKILTDSQNSTVINISDSFMLIITCILAFACINFASALSGRIVAVNKILFVALLIIPCITINYYILWKNDKYLSYFKEFDKEPKAVKQKWAWISLGVVIGSILLLIFSFWVMTNAIH